MGFQSSETVLKVGRFRFALLFHFGKCGGQYAVSNAASDSGASLGYGNIRSLTGGSTVLVVLSVNIFGKAMASNE
jgi:hypothetical protein